MLTRRVGLGGIALLALALGSLPAHATPATVPADFVPGSGSAIATSLKVGPQTGGLTIAVTFGQALADYEGDVGRASARAIDLGILSTALTAPGCFGAPATFQPSEFPQPLDADSRDPNAAKGLTSQQQGTQSNSPIVVSAGKQQVDAEDNPRGHAVTTTAAFALDPLLEVGAGRAEVSSQILPGGTRQSTATDDISSVSLAAGAVVLKGLHWEAVQSTGKDAVSTGSFTVGAVVINGKTTSLGVDGTQLQSVLAPINAALLGTGISIDPPLFTNTQGVVTVDPLRLRIDHSPLGQAVVAPAVTAAQPIREPVLNLYNQVFDCSQPVGKVQGVGAVGRGAILPSDIALSALTGTGGFVVELGGGSVTTEGNVYTNPFDTNLPPSPSGAESIPTDTSADTGAVLGATIDAGLAGGSGTAPAVPSETLTPGTAPSLANAATTVPGARGGTAVVMGVLGLLTVAGVGVADWLRIRRGNRFIPEEP